MSDLRELADRRLSHATLRMMRIMGCMWVPKARANETQSSKE